MRDYRFMSSIKTDNIIFKNVPYSLLEVFILVIHNPADSGPYL
jgi:hypothetical protein